MKKISSRKIWNKLNENFGQNIKYGQKHWIYNYLDVIIFELNDKQISSKEEFKDALDWHIGKRFTKNSDKAISAVADWCF